MDTLLEFPGRAYDYVNYEYGFVGLVMLGVGIVVGIVFVFIWMDRRR